MSVRVAICATLLAANLAYADRENVIGTIVEPYQAIVQVNGIVCSFCAYGAEKNLSRLPFLDDSQFGDNGVLIDIQSQRITLALQPDQQFDVAQVYDAIKKGGYDPVSFYVNVRGPVKKEGDRYFLVSPDSGQVFEIIGDDARSLVDRDLVNVQGQVDLERVVKIKDGQPIQVVITSSAIY